MRLKNPSAAFRTKGFHPKILLFSCLAFGCSNKHAVGKKPLARFLGVVEAVIAGLFHSESAKNFLIVVPYFLLVHHCTRTPSRFHRLAVPDTSYLSSFCHKLRQRRIHLFRSGFVTVRFPLVCQRFSWVHCLLSCQIEVKNARFGKFRFCSLPNLSYFYQFGKI